MGGFAGRENLVLIQLTSVLPIPACPEVQVTMGGLQDVKTSFLSN